MPLKHSASLLLKFKLLLTHRSSFLGGITLLLDLVTCLGDSLFSLMSGLATDMLVDGLVSGGGAVFSCSSPKSF